MRVCKDCPFVIVEHNNFTEDFLVCSRQELITEVKPFDECTVETALEEEEYEI